MFSQLFKLFAKKTSVNITVLIGNDFVKTHSDIYSINNRKKEKEKPLSEVLLNDLDFEQLINEKKQQLQIDTNGYLFDLIYSPILLLQKQYKERLSVITTNVDGIISTKIKDSIEIYGNINQKDFPNNNQQIDNFDLYNYLHSYMDMDQKPSFITNDSLLKNQLINAYLLSQHSDIMITLGISKNDKLLHQIFTYGKRFSSPITIDFGSSEQYIEADISFKFDKTNQFACYDDLKSVTNMILEIDDGLNKNKNGTIN